MKFNIHKKILTKARNDFNKGLFLNVFLFLKKKRIFFFVLKSSSSAKAEFFFIYGATLHRLGKYKKSIVYLKKTLYHPSDISLSEIYYFLISNYIKLNKIDFAKNYFIKLLDRSYDYFYILLIYYEFNIKKIDLNITNQNIQTLLPDDNESLTDKLTFAVFAIIENNLDKAYNLIKNDFKNNNDNFFYNLIFLKILFKLKKYDLIINYFHLNNYFLNCIDFLLIYAATLYKLKLFDECLIILNEILNLSIYNTEAMINKGKIYIIKKNYIKALQIFKTAYSKCIKNKDTILFYISLSYQKLGLLNDMINSSFKINSLTPEYSKSLFNISITCYDLSLFKKAQYFFLKINPDNIDLFKYKKWDNLINKNDQLTDNKIHLLKLIVFYLPISIIIFIFMIFILFTLTRK